MQGELTEIDVRSILQLIELGQRTGQLWVKTYGAAHAEATGQFHPLARSWFIFFVNGQIVYAGDPDAGVSRLQGMLERANPAMDWERVPTLEQVRSNAPEYGALWVLIEQRVLQPEKARSLLETMIRETLFELLGLHQGTFIFEMGEPLTPELMAWETSTLVAAVAQQVQGWKQFYPQIASPDQCPVVVDEAALLQSLPPATATALIQYAERRLSLRQLSHALNRDILTVARAIAPCIQRGWMGLSPWPPLETIAGGTVPGFSRAAAPPATPHIVCIDDALTIGQMIVGMLQPQGYAVTSLRDPVAALSKLFALQPDLILCDIDMPQLDGYQLCAMLRQCSQFHQTPILMLTGKDGFIDRVQAKMVGATDYLAKPFEQDELLMLVEQYLPPVSRQTAKIAPGHHADATSAPISPADCAAAVDEASERILGGANPNW